ncbi:MAG TPA: hypothetical protein VHN80_19185, partial [Kineosporiaceae bacterium]|nr:hypothetical protein [Kineosporiaceae bacterium]
TRSAAARAATTRPWSAGQPEEHPDRRGLGLACAVRAEEAGHDSGGQVEVEPVDHDPAAVHPPQLEVRTERRRQDQDHDDPDVPRAARPTRAAWWLPEQLLTGYLAVAVIAAGASFARRDVTA